MSVLLNDFLNNSAVIESYTSAFVYILELLPPPFSSDFYSFVLYVYYVSFLVSLLTFVTEGTLALSPEFVPSFSLSFEFNVSSFALSVSGPYG